MLPTTLARGAVEEVFFRGAVREAVSGRHAVTLSTAAHSLATTPTRNPGLVLASVVMRTVFGLQRKATGGISGTDDHPSDLVGTSPKMAGNGSESR